MKHVNTTDMYFQVINCEEIDELKQILNKYSPYYSNWRDYVNNVMLTNGLSYEKLGKKCGFSKNTIKGWVKNNCMPKSKIRQVSKTLFQVIGRCHLYLYYFPLSKERKHKSI